MELFSSARSLVQMHEPDRPVTCLRPEMAIEPLLTLRIDFLERYYMQLRLIQD